MKNLTHKLIESHLTSHSAMKPGDEIYVRIDQTLTHDITAVMGYLAFEALGLPRVKTELSVSYIDHNLLQIDNKTPDEGCDYDEEVVIDLSALEPLVACPHMPDIIRTVCEAEKVPVHQVFIGSCTNGSYSDFKKAAAVLKGHMVNENTSLVLGISSRQIYMKLLEDGVIAELISSGARITELACGACTGIGIAPPTNGVSVRTSNRNFKGRGGSADAKLYLVSPEVAAATAVKGVLAVPDEVMEDVAVLYRGGELRTRLFKGACRNYPDVSWSKGDNCKILCAYTQKQPYKSWCDTACF